jgi:PHS family inorganic phosphate transporter-like MFS transporter
LLKMGGKDWISFCSTALANFSAQYNFQSIAICLLIMSKSVCTADDGDCKSGDQMEWVTGTAEATIFIGAVVGQLGMGFLGDFLSRNQALSVTLGLSAVSAFLSAVAPAGSASSVYATIIVFRFFLGVGLGGIYPLSATKASEDSASTAGKTNSGGSAAAFWWQIPGSVMPWLLAYIFTHTSLSTGSRWRLILGLGAIPCLFSILCIWLESFKHTTGSATAALAGPLIAPPTISLATIREKLRDPVIRGKLIGCGGAWMLYDIVFYGLTLLGGVVIGEMSNGDDDVSTDTSIRNFSSKQSIALSLGAFSIFASMYLLPHLSLKYLTIWGFAVQGFFLLWFVALFTYLKAHDSNGLFALYCLAVMSLQFGVPVGTYALPASVFDKDIRCTFNGIAAAMGKLGAIIGAYSFYYIAGASIHAVLIICVVICVVGAYVTYANISEADLCNDDASTHALTAASEHGNDTTHEHMSHVMSPMSL